VFGTRNVYGEIVETLETTYDACSKAMHEAADIPAAKGGADIAHLVAMAHNCLHEALNTAKQWQESYDYHLNGSHGRRTDF